MKKRDLRSILLGLSLMCGPAAAQGPLQVDITQGVASLLPISIAEVSSGPLIGLPADVGDVGVALSHIVRDDLLSTGLYRLVPVEARPPADQELVLAPFMRAGAQALVVGRAQAADDGRRLAYDCLLYDVFGGRVETSQRIVVATHEWRRAAHQCADMVFSFTTGDPGHFDTRLLYVADGGHGPEGGQGPGEGAHFVATDYDGANASALARDVSFVAMPAFSPDTRRIAFLSYQEDQPRLVVTDLGSGQTRIFDIPGGLPSAPRFSPDGRSLVISIARDRNANIYAVEIGSGAVRQLTQGVGTDTSPGYSPDGASIVFESDRSGLQQLYIMGPDGSGQRRISFGAGSHGSPSWSPRGDSIAYTHMENNQLRIGIMKPDGTGGRIITDGPYDEDPAWALSGRAIAFQRTRAGSPASAIWVTDLTGRARHQVRTPGSASDPAWSGKRP